MRLKGVEEVSSCILSRKCSRDFELKVETRDEQAFVKQLFMSSEIHHATLSKALTMARSFPKTYHKMKSSKSIGKLSVERFQYIMIILECNTESKRSGFSCPTMHSTIPSMIPRLCATAARRKNV